MGKGTLGAEVDEAASDEALMAAYVRGDSGAFEQLYERWSDRLFGYLSRAFDAPTAEELFQTMWMRVHSGRHGYTPGRTVVPWLFAIAANLRREEWRRRKRRPEEPQATPAPPGTTASAEEAALGAERERAVRKALSALPDGQRDVIELHKFEHLSFPEIAEALGEGVEAVKSRAFRGYKALKDLLAGMQP